MCIRNRQISLSWDFVQFLLDKPKYCFSFYFTSVFFLVWVGPRIERAVRDAKWTLEKYKWDIQLWRVACNGTSTFCTDPVKYNRIIYNYLVMEDKIRLLFEYNETTSSHSMPTHYIKLVFFFLCSVFFCSFFENPYFSHSRPLFSRTKFANTIYFDTFSPPWDKQQGISGLNFNGNNLISNNALIRQSWRYFGP